MVDGAHSRFSFFLSFFLSSWCLGTYDARPACTDGTIAYYVAFGPYGPRTPVSPPGQGLKVFLYTMGLVGVAGLIALGVRSRGEFPASIRYPTGNCTRLTRVVTLFLAPPPPKTLTREWQEASNERAREQRSDPITGAFPSFHSHVISPRSSSGLTRV